MARQVEWTGGRVGELTWSGSELAGEVGEAAEILIAAEEPREDWSEWRVHLSEEIADSFICIDLAAISAGLGRVAAMKRAFTHPVHMSALLGISVGRVCNTLKKLERERRGWPGSRSSLDQLASQLEDLTTLLASVVDHFEIDVDQAVARKFNRTSQAVGLKSRLEL